MTTSKNSNYLNSINHFRAVAIVLIVAGHSYNPSRLKLNSDFEYFVSNLITGGTSLFVFISGFLFYHVFYKNFEYTVFIKKKLIAISSPYLILSIPLIAYLLSSKGYKAPYFIAHGDGFFEKYIIPAFKYLLTGWALPAYWYIPFILITFLLSPLHIKFIKLNISWKIFLIVVFFIISLLAHRPVHNLNVIQSVIYFIPVYLLGIFCSMYKENIYRYLHGKEVLLLIMVFAFSGLEVYFGEHGNYHKHFLKNGGIDLMLAQKIMLCLFFMVWLNRFNNYNNIAITKIADTSFAIFFIHGIFILLVQKSGFIARRADSWILYIIFVANIIVISMLLAIIVKKLLPKYSKYITGY